MHLIMNMVDDPVTLNRGQRVEQGGVYAGYDPMHTVLRSCLCVGVYCKEERLGGISHITGFSGDGGHHPAGAIGLLRKKLRRESVHTDRCEWFILGGSERARHVHDAAVAHLKEEGISFEELDVLGRYHRKLMLDPAAGALQVFRKPAAEPERPQEAKQFSDPARRIVTGASLLFRNRALLEVFEETILPLTAGKRGRCHVWCAGCSNGMEVYSLAMLGLDWLAERSRTADFLVLGSDVSKDALEVAQKGRYLVAGTAATETYSGVLRRYARSEGSRQVRMGRDVRQAVRFRQRDILSGSRGHRFELVVCDHVLQYFNASDQERMAAALVRAAAPGAFLYISTPTRATSELIAGSLGCRMFARHFYRAPG